MSDNFVERPLKNEKDEAIQYVNQLLGKAREENRNEEISKLEELIRLLHTKRYGLVWEEHAELVEEEMKSKIPVFVENKNKIIEKNTSSQYYNFLLEGDNLHSLYLLEKTHEEKVDIIYIDPPYNTGNKDFIYNDKIVDKTDAYSHSKWLSFMSKRLEIARRLLTDTGVIFISIDDNEQAQLKLLCDSIFGSDNFVGNFVRATGTTTGQDANKIGSSFDYCLTYRKTNKFVLKGVPLSEKDLNRFKEEDEKGKYSTLQLRKTGNEDRRENRPNMFYPIIAPDGEKVYPFGPHEYLSRWRVSQNTFNQLVEDNMIVWKENKKYQPQTIDGFSNSKWVPYVKYYATGRTKQVSNLLIDIEGNKKASIDLKNSVGTQKIFDYPKPLEFLRLLFTIAGEKDSIILDFFAGSGTTGHAVAQLNKEDGGDRKYILCTNNENNICEEITYKRLTKIQEELPHNLKYFKTEFVNKEEFPNFQLENELLNYITPLVEIEFGIDISNPSVQIILTEEQLEELIKEGKLEKDSTLFMHPTVLLNNKEAELLSKLNITQQIIPDYYFGKELWS